MEIADFAEMTYVVLQDTPIKDYIPTLCLPEKNTVHALQGIPAEEEKNLREISLDWALNATDEKEEFLVAFRDGPEHFRIIRRFNGELREALLPAKKPNHAQEPTTMAGHASCFAPVAPAIVAAHLHVGQRKP